LNLNLYVVIPIYNEEKRLLQTLDSLVQQSDNDFVLVLVDNGSSDGTPQLIADFQQAHSAMTIHCIHEAQKGIGPASDTGFRYAIAQGATHIARTDADCLVHPDWIRNIKRAFTERKLEFVGGVIKPRLDEFPLTIPDRLLISLLLILADITGWIRRRGRENKFPYIMVAGNNLAISAALYERAGGFPRISDQRAFEDRALSETVRKLTPHGARVRDVIVYNSIRRLRAYGYFRTVLWYLNMLPKPPIIDVR